MENASKALIIAGAILLAILLISLGIMIFNQAQDTVNNNGMSQAEMQAFNNKFIKYEGTRSGTEVKALINEVIASNADDSNLKLGSLRIINVGKYGNGTGYSEWSDLGTSKIVNNANYTVVLSYQNGIVNHIEISKIP